MASDGIFAGVWSRPTTETNFNIDIRTRDLDTGFNNVFHNVARFSTIGPVVFDSYTMTHPLGTLYSLTLSLKNNGQVTKATNITAVLTTPDTAAVANIVSGDQEGVDINVGETVELGQSFSIYTKDFTDIFPINIAILSDGYPFWSDSFLIDLTALSITRNQTVSNKFSLSQNYPNPFNPLTTIDYELPITIYVDLSIYNLLGQKVATLVNQKQPEGRYQIQWNAPGFASGVYYYRLIAGSFVEIKELVLLR